MPKMSKAAVGLAKALQVLDGEDYKITRDAEGVWTGWAWDVFRWLYDVRVTRIAVVMLRNGWLEPHPTQNNRFVLSESGKAALADQLARS